MMCARAKMLQQDQPPCGRPSASGFARRLHLLSDMPEPAYPTFLLEHARVDRAFETLSRAVRGGGTAADAFDALEGALLRHFEAEEQQLFADYGREMPDDAAALRDQHDELRARLAAARDLVHTGAFEERHLRELRTALSLHHAHEETGLYRWARSPRRLLRAV
jgi:hypothetical protein